MKISACCALLAVATIITCASGIRSAYSCHPNRNVETLGASCEGIYMPPKMCSKCKLAEYTSQGDFANCQAIYNIDDPECKAELEYYSQLNSCDTVRANQLEDFRNQDNHRALDYFVYSVCEECCDCIPRGARSDQYAARKAQGHHALISLVRGNCPAHAQDDICRIWPEIRHMTKPGGTLKLQFPKICPIMKSWFNSPLSQHWYSNDNTQMDWRIKRFLRIFNDVAKCSKRDTWTRCAGLETAQGRI